MGRLRSTVIIGYVFLAQMFSGVSDIEPNSLTLILRVLHIYMVMIRDNDWAIRICY